MERYEILLCRQSPKLTRLQILCRKEINYLKMSTKERDQLQAEFSILSSLRNPHIVQYYHREHIKQTQELYMYMEYCGGGDLGTIIRELKQKGKLAKEDFVWRILSQLLAALFRCHYGIDPPEPGDSARPADSKLGFNRTNPMILHRDLKPENIFLDGDKAVKLGDFGLSKIMQSHDFASTYVGTPFYMSPEICAAERYTLKSDIWALGCIIHELCTLEPPFNAQTHLQLVNKIRKGDVAPLPKEYSRELNAVVKNCLSTNPTSRPDTENLLNHPFVWVARKQQDCLKVTRSVTQDRDHLAARLKKAEEHVAELEADKITMRADLESQLRREWEVRAQLEIDRRVGLECQKLRSLFDAEVNKKVKEELAKQKQHSQGLKDIPVLSSGTQRAHNLNHHSSTNTSEESEWTNTTDLTDLSELSIQSPSDSTPSEIPPKKTKTPFARSKTTFDSPADIHMADPSPMSISTLNLSPRRQVMDGNQLSGKNLFTKIATNKARLAIPDDLDEDRENEYDNSDDEDGIPDLPSPTRPKMQNTDPFKMAPPTGGLASKLRPGLHRQHTIATTNRLANKPNLFPATGASSAVANQLRAGFAAATQPAQPSQIPRSATEGDIRNRQPSSPTQPTAKRRLSKIPSRGDLAAESALHAANGVSTSPLRRAVTTTGAPAPNGKLQSKLGSARVGLGDGTQQVNVIAGRTRVELAQARAGGRPMSADCGGNYPSSKNPLNGTYGIRALEKELPPVPVWDPEVLGEDAMPSPFLKRDTRTIRGLR